MEMQVQHDGLSWQITDTKTLEIIKTLFNHRVDTEDVYLSAE